MARKVACVVAALFMVIGATHELAHVHSDHDEDGVIGECVVCAVSAIDGAKISPAATAEFKPRFTFTGAFDAVRSSIVLLIDDAGNPVRGPPVFTP